MDPWMRLMRAVDDLLLDGRNPPADADPSYLSACRFLVERWQALQEEVWPLYVSAYGPPIITVEEGLERCPAGGPWPPRKPDTLEALTQDARPEARALLKALEGWCASFPAQPAWLPAMALQTLIGWWCTPSAIGRIWPTPRPWPDSCLDRRLIPPSDLDLPFWTEDDTGRVERFVRLTSKIAKPQVKALPTDAQDQKWRELKAYLEGVRQYAASCPKERGGTKRARNKDDKARVLEFAKERSWVMEEVQQSSLADLAGARGQELRDKLDAATERDMADTTARALVFWELGLMKMKDLLVLLGGLTSPSKARTRMKAFRARAVAWMEPPTAPSVQPITIRTGEPLTEADLEEHGAKPWQDEEP